MYKALPRPSGALHAGGGDAGGYVASSVTSGTGRVSCGAVATSLRTLPVRKKAPLSCSVTEPAAPRKTPEPKVRPTQSVT